MEKNFIKKVKVFIYNFSKFTFISYVLVLLFISTIGSLIMIYDNNHRIVRFLERKLNFKHINQEDLTTPIINESNYNIDINNEKKSLENLKGDEHLYGYWTKAFDWPVIAVHSILLPDETVLSFGSLAGENIDHDDHQSIFINKKIKLTDGREIERDVGEKQWEHHNVFWGSDFDIWDPKLGLDKNSHHTMVDPIKVNSFCSIIKVIDSENVFILGGDEKQARKNKLKSGPDTQKATVLYNIKNKKFRRFADLNYERWYGSAVRLKNDQILILGGRDNADLTDNLDIDRESTVPEILIKENNTFSWKVLHNIKSEEFFGRKNNGYNYPKAFLTKNNNVFGLSYNKMFLISDLQNRGAIEKVGEIPLVNNPFKIDIMNQKPNTKSSQERIVLGSIGSPLGWNSSTVMLRDNEIVTLGGIENGHLPSNHVYSIDINNPKNPILKRLSNMHFPRSNQNATIFPNGDLFVNGGNMLQEDVHGDVYGDNFSVLTPEVYRYKRNKWTKLRETNYRRNYHSTSLLLHDGKVLVAGGDTWNAQIYYPPYLFEKNRDGSISFAKKPFFKLLKSETKNEPGKKIIAKINNIEDISKISMISGGSITHSQPSELKYMELKFVKLNDNKLSVYLPEANHVNDGFYLLFAINSKGSPSLGQSLILN